MGSLDRFCTSAFGQILCGLLRLGEEHLLCVMSLIKNSFLGSKSQLWLGRLEDILRLCLPCLLLVAQVCVHFGAGPLRTFILIVL